MSYIVPMITTRVGINCFNPLISKSNFILNGYINGSQNSGKSGALLRLPVGYTFSDASIVYMQYNTDSNPIILSKTDTDLIFPVIHTGEIRIWGFSL